MKGVYCHSGHCRTARRVAAALTLSPRLLRSGALLVSTSPVSLSHVLDALAGWVQCRHTGRAVRLLNAFVAPAGTSPADPPKTHQRGHRAGGRRLLIVDQPNTLCRATRHAKTRATTPMKAMAP